MEGRSRGSIIWGVVTGEGGRREERGEGEERGEERGEGGGKGWRRERDGRREEASFGEERSWPSGSHRAIFLDRYVGLQQPILASALCESSDRGHTPSGCTLVSGQQVHRFGEDRGLQAALKEARHPAQYHLLAAQVDAQLGFSSSDWKPLFRFEVERAAQ